MPAQNITLPPVRNARAPEQWRIISEHVDFDGKTVLDLGCGYGDLLWRAWRAGAKYCLGIDESKEIFTYHLEKRIEHNTGPYFRRILIAEYSRLDRGSYNNADVTICFSVLPYVDNPVTLLHWIRRHSTQALIECPLSGDGPGFDWLKSSRDMRRWLGGIGWQSVERIGETTVEEHGAKRGIWLCS